MAMGRELSVYGAVGRAMGKGSWKGNTIDGIGYFIRRHLVNEGVKEPRNGQVTMVHV